MSSSIPISEKTAVAPPEKRTRKPVRKNGPGQYSRAYEIRIYPTPEQEEKLAQAIGCCRFLWNELISFQRKFLRANGSNPRSNDIQEALKALRADPERPWIAEVLRASHEQVIRNYDKAWTNYFGYLEKKKLGLAARKVGRPHYHAKSGSDGVRFQLDPRRLKNILKPDKEKLYLDRIGWVDCRVSEPWLGHITAATLSRSAGKWFASLTAVQVPLAESKAKVLSQVKLFEDPLVLLERFEQENPGVTCVPGDIPGIVALDLGVHTRATGSDGSVLPHPQLDERRNAYKKRHQRLAAHKYRVAAVPYLEKDRKAARLRSEQAALKTGEHGPLLPPDAPLPRAKKSRVPTSKRAQKELDRASACDLKELFIRKNAIHQFTTRLVQENHTIIVETLALYAMAQALNRGFRRRMHQSAMGEILRQLEYKCALYGRTLIKVDRWFASSKNCSTVGCQFRYAELSVSDRTWVCPVCGAHHDRDRNAAINLWHEGVRLLKLASEERPSCPTAGLAAAGRGRVKTHWSAQRPASLLRDAVKIASPMDQALGTGMEPGNRAVG